MSDRFFKSPQFVILATVFLFACAAFQASANELIQTLQNENASLKKKVEDFRVSVAALEQSEAEKKAELEKAEDEIASLRSKLDVALKRAAVAEERQKEADMQTSQAVATLKEMKAFVEQQASAVNAQKEEISATEEKNQALVVKKTEAEAARQAALKTADAARAEAQTAREKAIQEEANSHYNLGVVLAKHRKPVEAEKHFLACLALAPNDADAHYNLGILYEGALQSRSKAISHYERYLELRPSGPDADKVSQWLEEMQ